MITLPPDPWKVLGIERTAVYADIRTAYKKLVLQCHPDKVQDPVLKAQKQEEFQKVQQAWELLSDDTELKKYEEQEKLRELAKNPFLSKGMNTSATRRPPPPPQHYSTYDGKTAEPRINPSSPHHFSSTGKDTKYYSSSSSRPLDTGKSYSHSSYNDHDRGLPRRTSYDKDYENYGEKASRRADDRRREPSDRTRSKEDSDRRRTGDVEAERAESDKKDRKHREKYDREREYRDSDSRKKERDRGRSRTEGSSERPRRYSEPYVEDYEIDADQNVYSTSAKGEKKKPSKSSKHDRPAAKSSSRREKRDEPVHDSRREKTEEPLRDSYWEKTEEPPVDKTAYLKQQAANYIMERRRKSSSRQPSFEDDRAPDIPSVPSPPPPERYPNIGNDSVPRSSAHRHGRSSYDDVELDPRRRERLPPTTHRASRERVDRIDIVEMPSSRSRPTLQPSYTESPPRSSRHYKPHPSEYSPLPTTPVLGRSGTWGPGDGYTRSPWDDIHDSPHDGYYAKEDYGDYISPFKKVSISSRPSKPVFVAHPPAEVMYSHVQRTTTS